jgi:hypothetical protein
MIDARGARLILGALIIGVTAGSLSASTATAASYTTYVGCSISSAALPSHVCQIGDQPGAFFESAEAEVEYEVCVTFPGPSTICAEEQPAEAEVLYVNEITTEITGNHLVTWYVEGAEIASWSFRVDNPPPAPPASSPVVPLPSPTMLPPPTVTPPTALGCSLSSESAIAFAAHPRHCAVFRKGRHDRAHEIQLSKLQWSNWGANIAAASGRWKYCEAGKACATGPLEATATRRVFACDHFVYTRLTLHLLSPKRDRTYSLLRLPAC